MPRVIVEDLPKNCQVTIVVTELIDVDDDPNPPAEMPEGVEPEVIKLVGKSAGQTP
jgi:hypothetical protein